EITWIKAFTKAVGMTPMPRENARRLEYNQTKVTAMYTNDNRIPVPSKRNTERCSWSARDFRISVAEVTTLKGPSFRDSSNELAMDRNLSRRNTVMKKHATARPIMVSRTTIKPWNRPTSVQTTRLAASSNSQIEIRSPTFVIMNASAARLSLIPYSMRKSVRYEAIPAPVATKFETEF